MEKFKAFLNRISHNLGLKLLALASAFVIWIGVVNITDPIDSVTFNNVPVLVINEDSLTAKDKIPEIVDGKTVTVTIEARKSICDSLTSSNIFAIADFEQINIADAVPISITVEGVNRGDYEIIRGRDQYMKLSLEDYATKEFKIKIETVGEPANGYVVAKSVASPNVISVYGSKMQISRIRDIIVTVDVSGSRDEVIEIVTPVVYDMNDDEIVNSKLELSQTAISVSTTVYKTKNMPIRVEVVGEPLTGFEIAKTPYSCQPSSVMVYGSDEELAKLGDYLTLTVDVHGQHANVEKNVNVLSLIDYEFETIGAADEDDMIAVTAYIVPSQNAPDTDASGEDSDSKM